MKKYRAFISYSQKDKIWARRIQKSLETYRIPLGVAVDGLAKRKLGRFFRDDDELASAASLGEALQGAIRDSESMIVIASPNAARSKWVNEEIRTFKQTHGPDRIFAVIVAGRPFASEEGAPDDECFPLALRRVVAPDGTITDQQDEPLAPDVTKDSFPRIRARLAAGLLGLGFDELWRRDRRRRLQRAGIAACGAAIAVAGVGFGLIQLSASRNETALQESRLMAEQAQGLIDTGRLDDALKLIVQALPADLEAPDRPVASEALVALTRMMTGNPDLGVVAQFDSEVQKMVTTSNQEVIASLENGSFAALAQGQVAETYTPAEYMTLLPNGNAQRHFSNERNVGDRWVFDQTLSEINITTGEQVGGFAYTDPEAAWFLMNGVASGDGRLFAARGGAARAGQVAVFERPIPASNAPQKPIGILKTDIEYISDAKLGFAAGDTLVLFDKDETSQLILRWTVGAASPEKLIPTDAAGVCPQPVTDTLARSHVSISPDGEVISLAEPTGDISWCLTSWDSRTGGQLQRVHFEDRYASLIQPLARERWLAVPGSSSFGRSPAILSADGGQWELYGCDGSNGLATGLSLNPTQANILFLDNARIACSAGTDILLQSAGSPARTLSSHTADISALTVTRDADGDGRLWSADRSGMVRMWDLGGSGQAPEPGQSEVPIIARSAQSIAMLSAQRDGGMAASVWTPKGAALLAVTPVPLLSEVETPGSVRQVAMQVPSADKALITEAFQCPFTLSDAPPTDCSRSSGRATVLDLQTGLALAVVDDLARGGADLVPLATHRDRLVLVGVDGTLLEVDLATQERVTLPVPSKGRVRDVAIVGGVLWAATLARLSDDMPGDQWRLYKRMANNWEIVLDQRVLGMSLHPSPKQDKAVVVSETLDQIQATMVASEGVTVRGTPFEKRMPLVIQPPGLVGALLLDEDGITALQADGKMQDLPAFSMATSYDFRNRAKLSDDHAMLVWLGDAEAQIFRLPEGSPSCAGLSFSDPEDAVFSPDSTRLAIKVDSGQDVVVVDLSTCAVLRRVPAEGGGAMTLTDNDTLWQTARDGRQLITTKAEPQQLLNRAIHLVETLQ